MRLFLLILLVPSMHQVRARENNIDDSGVAPSSLYGLLH